MAVNLKPAELLTYHDPKSLGLVYCSVQRIELNEGTVLLESCEQELCLIVVRGDIQYQCGDQSGEAKTCDMLYVPVRSRVAINGRKSAVMRYGAPCSEQFRFQHIRFDDVDRDDRHKVYGKKENGTLRDVWNFIDDNFPSGRFLTGICRGRDGGWTAWPPHEHGREREEVYVYLNMDGGFGVQCVYDDMEHPRAYMVQEGDLVSIPSGFHPNAGCPCGGLHYAFVMVSTVEGERCFMNLRTQKIYGDKLE